MHESPPPQLDVRAAGAACGSGPWDVAFNVTNGGERRARLLEARLPHTILHAAAVDLSTSEPLDPGASVTLRFSATFQPREPGEPSNPFLILRLLQDGVEWRLLARLGVGSGTKGEPVTNVDAVTVHQVGFSQRDG